MKVIDILYTNYMHPEIQIQEKLNEQIKSNPPPKPHNLWFDIGMYSLVIFIIISLYIFATQGTYDLRAFSRATANVGIILIGLSFMLSGLCYFWNFADHFIIYRKQLGVIGFIYALMHTSVVLYHAGTTQILIPTSLTRYGDIALISAEIAIIIYVGMTIISTQTVIHEIGGQRWRQLLRWGYIGLILSLLHMFIKGSYEWLSWLTGKSVGMFPAIGLLIFIFGIAVILLRIKLWYATYFKKTSISQTPPSQTQPI